MSILKINETTVRTSRNFNINNVKLEDIQIPENLKEFKKKVNKEVFEISALTGEGIDKVLVKIADELDNIKDEPLYENEQFEKYVLYKFKE